VRFAALFYRLPFDLTSGVEDLVGSAEVHIGRCQVVQAFVVAVVIVVIDEGCDGALKIARQVIVLEQDAALERQVPSLDLALGHQMIGLAMGVGHTLAVEPVGKFARDIGRATGRRRAVSPASLFFPASRNSLDQA